MATHAKEKTTEIELYLQQLQHNKQAENHATYVHIGGGGGHQNVFTYNSWVGWVVWVVWVVWVAGCHCFISNAGIRTISAANCTVPITVNCCKQKVRNIESANIYATLFHGKLHKKARIKYAQIFAHSTNKTVRARVCVVDN